MTIKYVSKSEFQCLKLEEEVGFYQQRLNSKTQESSLIERQIEQIDPKLIGKDRYAGTNHGTVTKKIYDLCYRFKDLFYAGKISSLRKELAFSKSEMDVYSSRIASLQSKIAQLTPHAPKMVEKSGLPLPVSDVKSFYDSCEENPDDDGFEVMDIPLDDDFVPPTEASQDPVTEIKHLVGSSLEELVMFGSNGSRFGTYLLQRACEIDTAQCSLIPITGTKNTIFSIERDEQQTIAIQTLPANIPYRALIEQLGIKIIIEKRVEGMVNGDSSIAFTDQSIIIEALGVQCPLTMLKQGEGGYLAATVDISKLKNIPWYSPKNLVVKAIEKALGTLPNSKIVHVTPQNLVNIVEPNLIKK